MTNTPDKSEMKAAFDAAAEETARLQRELDITNADHIALWLEANTIADEPMSQCISWLACRIVEAHETASSRPPADQVPDMVERLGETLHDLSDSLRQILRRKAMTLATGGFVSDAANVASAQWQWVAQSLHESIANLGYPVGMGMSPHAASTEKAARAICDYVACQIDAALTKAEER